LSPTDRLQPANDAKHYGSTATGGVKRSATAADDVRSTAANDALKVGAIV